MAANVNTKTAPTPRMVKMIAHGTHSGENTIHQLQSIRPKILAPKNAKVRTVVELKVPIVIFALVSFTTPCPP